MWEEKKMKNIVAENYSITFNENARGNGDALITAKTKEWLEVAESEFNRLKPQFPYMPCKMYEPMLHDSQWHVRYRYWSDD
jgi:hypothetical protein